MTAKVSTEPTSKNQRYVHGATVLAGLFTLALGVWAFFAPRSFYEQLATFDPYNRHLIHDIGAFQLAIAAAMLAAERWRDTLAVVLSAGPGSAIVVSSPAQMDGSGPPPSGSTRRSVPQRGPGSSGRPMSCERWRERLAIAS
jgi:hypothetical protein